MIADPNAAMTANMQQNQQNKQASDAKKAGLRAAAVSGGPEPKTVPDGSDIRQAALAPTMHKGGTVPGKPGQEVMIKALAGEKIIPASESRNSEYRKVYVGRKNNKS